jgi:hypothetical protein
MAVMLITSPVMSSMVIQYPTSNAFEEIFKNPPVKHIISSFVDKTTATATAVRDRAKVCSCGAYIKSNPTTTRAVVMLLSLLTHRRLSLLRMTRLPLMNFTRKNEIEGLL